ncbi:osmoprotectant transport system permease protein [Polymorphobacter multimanifer]|uniref:Osmoprotectant transport system permease protein n=2 Tax=Polymorphobacter multimanifer TaxID=1070431 RepID=A0A841L3Z2_9SPHN|nr:ABC transporter permease/substrate-binding protein [Polymorphobacter multimanifer]MBB6226161.1 osmoprotectant transport system permease protein [Polymorphobacter multimanifer]
MIANAAWDRAIGMLPDRMAAHLGVSAAAVGLALLIAVPVVLVMAGRPRLRAAVLTAAGVVQTVPALALLALFYPLLLALSALTERLAGFGVPALGFLPSMLALTLYALLPLLRGGADGLASVPPATLDAADGIGMTRGQRLLHVELPMAAPIIIGGLRTAAVWTIGAATLATTVGQKSLGDLIFAGLQLEDWALVVTGCLAAAALAIITDMALWRVETGIAARKWRKAGLGGALLAAMVAAVLALWWNARPPETAERPVVVGAKSFGEQYILAELIASRLREQGLAVTVRSGLGSAVAFRALTAGDIDLYVDYSGTLWSNALGRTDVAPRASMIATLRTELPRRHKVQVAAVLGFENAYALAMQRTDAERLGIASLADLARQSDRLRLATDTEFQSREEWAALQRAYGLRFARLTAYTPTLMVRALIGGEADVMTAFSSDGRIAADDLTLLTDPAGALPSYDAMLLIGPTRPDLARRLQALEGRIAVEAMRQANWQVDRATDKRTPEQAARWLAGRIAEK